MTKRQIFLLDSHGLCYRAFYAIRDLANSQGQPTNAVFGFTNILRKILRDHDPHYIVACFDSKEKTLREQKYAEYKIQRQPMPEALSTQIPLIREVLGAFQIPIVEAPGYEADDLMASVARKYAGSEWDVVLVTDDKDMYQLMSENVHILSVRLNQLMKLADVQKRIGYDPRLITEMIALAGDSSDNIPGVRGIGKVTATKLINSYGTLEKIYESLDDISPASVRKKLEDGRESAQMSRDLACLEDQYPLDVDMQSFRRAEPDRETLFRVFKDMEFGRLAQEYAPIEAPVEFKEEAWQPRSLESDADWDNFLGQLAKVEDAVIYHDRSQGDLNERMFCHLEADVIFHFSVNQIERLLASPEMSRVCWIVFDIKALYRLFSVHEYSQRLKSFDVLLSGYLLSANQSSNTLAELSWHFLSRHLPKDATPVVCAQILRQLHPLMQTKLEETDLQGVFADIEQPLSYVLAVMESRGVELDVSFLREMSVQCQKKLETLTEKIYDLAGEPFNLNSPKQLARILFEKLELPPIKKTKTGFSTDESVLTRLAASHEVPSLILEYRMLSKLKSTYIDALPKLADSRTNRIHAEFNQIGTETGRLSSRNPNLQNIPIRTELGRKIRKAFVSTEKDWGILKADYSQIELRILAHLSADEQLLKAFQSDEDIHRFTASLIFDTDESAVDATMRDTAKRVNFGIVYGMSGFGLAKDLGIPQQEANEFITKYFARYPKVKTFMDSEIQRCREMGYVTTLFKRRRYLPEINSRNPNSRQFAERQAINTPVQGSAADLIKLAMIRVQSELERSSLKGRMIITVHDELVLESPKDELNELAQLVQTQMEGAVELTVPLKVDMRFGRNWLDTEEVIVEEVLAN